MTTANDVNCLGSSSLVKTGNKKEIEISQVVTHIEYKIKIQNVTLVANPGQGHLPRAAAGDSVPHPKPTRYKGLKLNI